MTDQPTTERLSGEEVTALKAAAHRQLARWAKKSELSPHQRAQRAALARAVRILANHSFAQGCELHVASGEDNAHA
jgi:hypothetical protein